jgi:CheY-like chemotaxis protein
MPRIANLPATEHEDIPPHQAADALLRVVVIDDDTTLIHAVSELLADYGIQVIAFATDGCQTLNALTKAEDLHGQVDALIIDERLPHTRGLEATRLVRRFYPDLPVILHTAYAGLLGDEPRQAGVTAQVSKADHPLALVRAIRSARDPQPLIALI